MSKKCCLGCGIGIIVIVGFGFLMSWIITAQIRSPKCSIEKFYVPALDKGYSSNKNATTSNTTISFDLRFKNENGDGTGFYYDALNISLYYYQKGNTGGHLKRLPIGNVSIPGFYQAKVDHRLETVQTFGVPWEETRMVLSNGSSTMFLLDLASSIKLKISFRYSSTMTDRKKLNLGVNVSVNDRGMKTTPGSLRLTSASSLINIPCSTFVVVLSVLCLI